MPFTSLTFLFIFLPAFLAIFYLMPASGRRVALGLGSLVFLVWAGPGSLVVVLASVIVNHFLGLLIARRPDKKSRNRILTISVIVNLIALLVFKYATFFTWNFNLLLTSIGMKAFQPPHLLLPLGISFYTFRVLSYHIELARQKVVHTKNAWDFALYICYFPQLSAGPIVRYAGFWEPSAGGKLSMPVVAGGARRFMLGLVKKVLLANGFGVVADAVFGMPAEELTMSTSWLGAVSYMLQIYYDFSGYTDMAIGLTIMTGFRAPENFNYPYRALSVKDFWRRWHMTLTSWFRDYLFLPLALWFSRKMPAMRYWGIKTDRLIYGFAIAITWLLVGFWHGPSWTFCIWGLTYGLFLVLEQFYLERKMRKLPPFLRSAYTLLVVLMAWVFFRSADFTSAFGMVKAMLGSNGFGGGTFEYYRYMTPGFLIAMIIGILGAAGWLNSAHRNSWAWILSCRPSHKAFLKSAYRLIAGLLLFAGTTFSVAEILRGTFTPFIYIRF